MKIDTVKEDKTRGLWWTCIAQLSQDSLLKKNSLCMSSSPLNCRLEFYWSGPSIKVLDIFIADDVLYWIFGYFLLNGLSLSLLGEIKELYTSYTSLLLGVPVVAVSPQVLAFVNCSRICEVIWLFLVCVTLLPLFERVIISCTYQY